MNLLRQSNVDPSKSAFGTWEFFNGQFTYDATPMGPLPLGIEVLIHKKAAARNSWDFRCQEGWNVGVSLDLEYYRCQRAVAKDTKSEQISDAVEFRHQHLTIPIPTATDTVTVTPEAEDRVLRGINTLSDALKLKGAPSSICVCDNQLQAISALRNICICTAWAQTLPAAATSQAQAPSPRRTATAAAPAARVVRPSAVHRASSPSPPQCTSPSPQVELSVPRVEPSSPRVETSISYEPVAHRTRSRTQSTSLPTESPTTSQWANAIHPASAVGCSS